MSLRPRQLRRVGNQRGLPIVVTEVQHGAVDTAMLKRESPLLRDARASWRRLRRRQPNQTLRAAHRLCTERDLPHALDQRDLAGQRAAPRRTSNRSLRSQ